MQFVISVIDSQLLRELLDEYALLYKPSLFFSIIMFSSLVALTIILILLVTFDFFSFRCCNIFVGRLWLQFFIIWKLDLIVVVDDALCQLI